MDLSRNPYAGRTIARLAWIPARISVIGAIFLFVVGAGYHIGHRSAAAAEGFGSTEVISGVVADTTTICDALEGGDFEPDSCTLLSSQERQNLLDYFELAGFRDDHPNCNDLALQLSDMVSLNWSLAGGTGDHSGITAFDGQGFTIGTWFHEDIIDGTVSSLAGLKEVIKNMYHARNGPGGELEDEVKEYCSGASQILPPGWPQPD